MQRSSTTTFAQDAQIMGGCGGELIGFVRDRKDLLAEVVLGDDDLHGVHGDLDQFLVGGVFVDRLVAHGVADHLQDLSEAEAVDRGQDAPGRRFHRSGEDVGPCPHHEARIGFPFFSFALGEGAERHFGLGVLDVEDPFAVGDAHVVNHAELTAGLSQGERHVHVGHGGVAGGDVVLHHPIVAHRCRREAVVPDLHVVLEGSSGSGSDDDDGLARPALDQIVDREVHAGAAHQAAESRDLLTQEVAGHEVVTAVALALLDLAEVTSDHLDAFRGSGHEDVVPDVVGGQVGVVGHQLFHDRFLPAVSELVTGKR